MSNSKINDLLLLIQSLSKAEKRNFKLYVNRISHSSDVKFVKLFDALDKMTNYDGNILIKKTGISRSQLSNTKSHLYKQLLISLRLSESSHDVEIGIREQLDFAKVLYNKGLYKQSSKIIEKIKESANENALDVLGMEIIQFEKLIELQYITRSIDEKAERLAEEANRITSRIALTNKLSNLALRLYGLYLKQGHIRDQEHYEMVDHFFRSHLPDIDEASLSFNERLYYYQAHCWYHYIMANFVSCYRYALKWVNLFNEFPQFKIANTELYLKGLSNLLSAIFMTNDKQRLKRSMKLIDKLKSNPDIHFNDNLSLLYFQFYYSTKINYHFLIGDFSGGLSIVSEIEKGLEKWKNKLDHHQVLNFYYKIACLYFGSGDPKSAITYLNRIINFKDVGIKEDVHCFARILNLICHFELGNNELLEYQIRSTYRYLIKMDEMYSVQRHILHFLRKLSYIQPADLNQEFINLREELYKLKGDVYERRPFLYLDIINWLTSKIENRPVQDVIKENGLSIQ